MDVRAERILKGAPEARRRLLAWFARHRRSMPWRESPSAYRTVVSELMCQQTQIATVIPYFERWTLRWPDFAALASAQEAEVLALWAGLGYYSRARNLLGLARAVVARGGPPTTAEAWREFRGVGPYTAAAIASIAYGEPVAVVDGNVVRVLARLTGDRTVFRDAGEAARKFGPLADALVDRRRPGDFNQAMMELGSLVCRKAAPDCAACPLRSRCATAEPERAAEIPRFAARRRRTETVDRVVVVRAGRVLLFRHPPDARRLAGIAEIPSADSLGLRPRGRAAAEHARAIGDVAYRERLHRAGPSAALLRRARAGGFAWVPFGALEKAALSGPHLRWLRQLLSPAGPKARGRRP
ncbi:MAG: A/G-specific adenine glycosylase [Opitutales bacterium]|jgi:A/G-specific adenine glycosylase